jgi:hypothetical protein
MDFAFFNMGSGGFQHGFSGLYEALYKGDMIKKTIFFSHARTFSWQTRQMP